MSSRTARCLSPTHVSTPRLQSEGRGNSQGRQGLCVRTTARAPRGRLLSRSRRPSSPAGRRGGPALSMTEASASMPTFQLSRAIPLAPAGGFPGHFSQLIVFLLTLPSF